MSRHYDERIEVQLGEPVQDRLSLSAARVSSATVVPTAFVWKGRVHVVQAVIAHWTQRLPWWREAWHDEAAEQLLQHEVWRVEARTGIGSDVGIYDLAGAEHWQLVQVAD